MSSPATNLLIFTPRLNDPSLVPMKRLIADKSPSEILAISIERAEQLASLAYGLGSGGISIASAGEARYLAQVALLAQYRLELNFLNAIVDGRAVRKPSPVDSMLEHKETHQ